MWQPQHVQLQTVFSQHGGGRFSPKMSQSICLLYTRILFTPRCICFLKFLTGAPTVEGYWACLNVATQTSFTYSKMNTLNVCNWITDVSFLSFYRLQGDVVRLWCRMRARPNRPLQGRVCLQESGMSLFSGACLRLGFVYLLQWVRARKSPVQRTATHQSATPGSLL